MKFCAPEAASRQKIGNQQIRDRLLDTIRHARTHPHYVCCPAPNPGSHTEVLNRFVIDLNDKQHAINSMKTVLPSWYYVSYMPLSCRSLTLKFQFFFGLACSLLLLQPASGEARLCCFIPSLLPDCCPCVRQEPTQSPLRSVLCRTAGS